MNKKRYIILAFMLFLLNIQHTNAACTQEEIDAFKQVEDKYTVKYEFNKTNKTYTMYFKNPEPEKYSYIVYSEKILECSDVDEKTRKCINFPSGKYYVEIKGKTNACDTVLKEIDIEIPEYNKYSDDPLCKGIEEFVLCSPTYNKEIDYDTFMSRVETYKKSKMKKEEEENEKVEPAVKENKLTPIINYIKENLITIIIVTVFIILLTTTIIISAKSFRKSRRLE